MKFRCLLVCFFILSSGCVTFSMPDAPAADAELRRILQGKKIALVGFYTFKVEQDFLKSVGNVRHFTATLDYKSNTLGNLPLGKRVVDIQAGGLDTGVEQKDIKNFIDNYLTRVRRSGARELSHLFTFRRTSAGKRSISLKKRDVDFYVVGYHGPPFEGKLGGARAATKNILSVFPFVFTLGTFPMISEREWETEIRVYDRKLRPVKFFRRTSYINIYTAWWGSVRNGLMGTPTEKASQGMRKRIYDVHNHTFAREFAGDLKGKK